MPKRHFIGKDKAFEGLRYGGDDFINKAAMLPIRFDTLQGEYAMLVAAPKPVRSSSDTVPYAIARGTRQMLLNIGEKPVWVDIRWDKEIKRAQSGDPSIIKVEPPLATAVHEAEEELGLWKQDIRQVFDAGVLAYKNYGIHCFACELCNVYTLRESKDSRDVRWLTLRQAEEMSAEGSFNPGYFPLLQALYTASLPLLGK